jgi:hypothetical protein
MSETTRIAARSGTVLGLPIFDPEKKRPRC